VYIDFLGVEMFVAVVWCAGCGVDNQIEVLANQRSKKIVYASAAGRA